jgi:hypothetical protein
MKDKTSSYRFVSPGAGKISGSVVLLFPFRNLAAHEFSFPFIGTSKARDALKIQYKPLLGEGVQNVGFIPFFTRIEKKTSSGCAFIVREDEATEAEKQASGIAGDCAVWPSSLAFAGEVGPNGLIVWSDGDFTTSVWIKNWTPALYRTVSGETSPEEEERRAVEYIEQAGGVIEKTLIVESSDVSVDDMQSCGARTLKLCPMYAALDLSGRGANIQEERERLFDAVSKISRVAVISGLVFLAVMLALFARQSSIAAESALAPGAVYESAFEERSMQPVASSLTKLRSSRDGTPETISAILEDISSVYGRIGEGENIVFETLRYGSDGTDILGTSKNNDSIQRLRSLLEDLGYTARTDNIETVPGGDMRFNMNISRGVKK